MYFDVSAINRIRDDIKLYFSYAADNFFSATVQDLTANSDLENAVLISLMTDARATPDDVKGQEDSLGLRGWWGDHLLGFSVGSKRWTFKNRKLDDSLLSALEADTENSLLWMVEDGIIESVKSRSIRKSKTIFMVETSMVEAQSGRVVKFIYYYDWTTGNIGGNDGV